MMDINDEVGRVLRDAGPTVDTAVTWRDKYLQWVSAHPKTVSVLLAVVTVWAALATIKV